MVGGPKHSANTHQGSVPTSAAHTFARALDSLVVGRLSHPTAAVHRVTIIVSHSGRSAGMGFTVWLSVCLSMWGFTQNLGLRIFFLIVSKHL